jgi:hypothetical protein
MWQSAFQDNNQVPILAPLTLYSVRVRLAQDGALTAGNLFTIQLYSLSTGFNTLVTVSSSIVTTNFVEFILNFPQATPSPIPSDLL